MWSLGCILSELYTGYPLFPGLDENELLEFHILMRGPPPRYIIDKCKKKTKFYNVEQNYQLIRSPKSRLQNITSVSPTAIYDSIFVDRFPDRMDIEDIEACLTKEERYLIDFIKRCLIMDPK
jgi:dual specificity tyrosine-phosphorylation-regulated kinase 2/3/4